MKPKIDAKKIIKSLLFTMALLWLSSYLYFLSNKTSGLLFDYGIELFNKKEALVGEANKKPSPYSPSLVPIYKELCQITLCQNNLPSAENYINTLLKSSDQLSDSIEQANLYLFAANIYRDFKSFAQAQKKYEKALFLINSVDQKANLKDWDLNIIKARILNNQGATYLLQGKSETNRSQRWKDYDLAKKYLTKAAEILGAKNDCLYKTIHTNLEQCLSEMSFLH